MADQQNNRAKKPTRRTASTAGQRATAKPASSAASTRRSVGGTGSASTRRTRSTSSTATARPATTHVQPKSTPKEMVESLLRTSIVARIVVVALAVLIVVGIGDALANLGKAYPGVSIHGVDVSGMTAEEMRPILTRSLTPEVEQADINIYASEEARASLTNETTKLEDEALAEQLSIEEARESYKLWTPTPASLGASPKIEEAINDALSYGRGLTNIPARIGAALFGHDIEMKIDFDDFAINTLADEIDWAIGDARIDTTIEVWYGYAEVVDGHDGMLLDREAFKKSIETCIVDRWKDSGFVATPVFTPSRITHDQAQQVADMVNAQLERSKVFTYNEQAWEPDSNTVGNWIVATVEEAGNGYALNVSINKEWARDNLLDGIFSAIDTEAWKITFEKSGDDIVVHMQGEGSIPDFMSAVNKLNEEMFGKQASTGDISIEIASIDVPESLSFDEARELGLVSVIGDYTTEFSTYEGTENRNYNIRHAAEVLNNTIAKANGGYWSFNDNTGDTNDATGYAAAGSIINGEYVDSIGGGICQVATTIFNAVYESGLDVVSRTAHELYIASYPNGRDAAVSYPYLDFAWENNLESDVLVTFSTTDHSITCTLYSTATGYWVESVEGEWYDGDKYETKFETDEDLQKGSYYTKTHGEDGSSITVYRTVYDHAGDVVLQDSFMSVYAPKDEVIVVGPDTDTKPLSREEREKNNG